MIHAKDQPFWAVVTMIDGVEQVLALLANGHHVRLLRAIVETRDFGSLAARPPRVAVSFKEVSAEEFEGLQKSLEDSPEKKPRAFEKL
ncbi:MAG: hypothetical protein WA628_25435 [Terriglobales bacterium]